MHPQYRPVTSEEVIAHFKLWDTAMANQLSAVKWAAYDQWYCNFVSDNFNALKKKLKLPDFKWVNSKKVIPGTSRQRSDAEVLRKLETSSLNFLKFAKNLWDVLQRSSEEIRKTVAFSTTREPLDVFDLELTRLDKALESFDARLQTQMSGEFSVNHPPRKWLHTLKDEKLIDGIDLMALEEILLGAPLIGRAPNKAVLKRLAFTTPFVKEWQRKEAAAKAKKVEAEKMAKADKKNKKKKGETIPLAGSAWKPLVGKNSD